MRSKLPSNFAAASALALLPGVAGAAPFQEASAPCNPGLSTICYGERAICTLSSPSQTHVYKFMGAYRDRVRVTVAGRTNDLDPKAQVFDSTGTLVASTFCNTTNCCVTCSTMKEFELPGDDTYTLLVSDNGTNNAGEYALDLQLVPPAHGAPIIDYGQTVNVVVSHQSDHDFLTFEAVAGTWISVGVSGKTNDLDCRLQLFDPNGDKVLDDYCVTTNCCVTCSFDTGLIQLLESGTYHMALFDHGYNNNGNMDVTLSCVIGNCPPPNPPASIGTSYCSSNPNSSGNPALIAAFGSAVVADNDVRLTVQDAPTGQFGLFFMGQTQTFVPMFSGTQGNLCILPLDRLSTVLSCNSGEIHFDLDLTDLPHGVHVLPGETWNFQAWFRDLNPNATSNTSDGVEVQFL